MMAGDLTGNGYDDLILAFYDPDTPNQVLYGNKQRFSKDRETFTILPGGSSQSYAIELVRIFVYLFYSAEYFTYSDTSHLSIIHM